MDRRLFLDLLVTAAAGVGARSFIDLGAQCSRFKGGGFEKLYFHGKEIIFDQYTPLALDSSINIRPTRGASAWWKGKATYSVGKG